MAPALLLSTWMQQDADTWVWLRTVTATSPCIRPIAPRGWPVRIFTPWKCVPTCMAWPWPLSNSPGGPSCLAQTTDGGATQTLARGAFRAAKSMRLCATFWNLAGANATPVWIEDVAGRLNPPDPPPRECTFRANACPLCSKRREVPSIPHRILLSANSLKGSQFPIPVGTRGCTPPHRVGLCPNPCRD